MNQWETDVRELPGACSHRAKDRPETLSGEALQKTMASIISLFFLFKVWQPLSDINFLARPMFSFRTRKSAFKILPVFRHFSWPPSSTDLNPRAENYHFE
jgi:hypothetical protein